MSKDSNNNEKTESFLVRLSEIVKNIGTVALYFLAIVTVFILISVAVSEYWQDRIVLDAVNVTGGQEGAGMTSEAATALFQAALVTVQEKAGTDKEQGAINDASEEQEIVIPNSDISISRIVHYLKQLFGYGETGISASFFCKKNDCGKLGYDFQVEVSGKEKEVFAMPAKARKGYEDIFNDAALKILSIIDPYTVAVYYSNSDSDRSSGLAKSLYYSNHEHADWAAVLLCHIDERKGDYGRALEWCDRALEKNWYLAQAHNTRGSVYRRVFNDAQAQDGRDSPDATAAYGNAIASYRIAARLAPRFATPRYGIANVFLDNGEPEKAIRYFETAIRLGPEVPSFYYGYAKALRAIARKQVRQIDPGSDQFEANREDIIKRYSMALDYYIVTREREEDSARAHLGIGNTYRALARLGEDIGANIRRARKSYHRALANKPDYGDAFTGIGLSFLYEGELLEAGGSPGAEIYYQLALDCFEKAKAAGVDEPDIYINIARVKGHLGRLGKNDQYSYDAIGDYLSAAKYPDKNDKMRQCIQMYVPDPGKDTMAEFGRYYDYGAVLSIEGEHDQVNECRGHAYERIGDPEKARAEYRAAIEKAPGVPGSYYRLGMLLRKNEDFCGARDMLEKFMKLQPFGIERARADKIVASIEGCGPQ